MSSYEENLLSAQQHLRAKKQQLNWMGEGIPD
jgi:hypothetical protein